MWVSCPQNHIPDYIEIFEEPRTNQNIRHSVRQYGVRVRCIILSFWFLVIHGVCHLDIRGGNPHVKYLCAVANFYDEYYLVIGSSWEICLSMRQISLRESVEIA